MMVLSLLGSASRNRFTRNAVRLEWSNSMNLSTRNVVHSARLSYLCNVNRSRVEIQITTVSGGLRYHIPVHGCSKLTASTFQYNLKSKYHKYATVMIQSFRTDMSRQTVQTQIRLVFQEQSDQGLHCLLFHLHLFGEIPKGLASFLEF